MQLKFLSQQTGYSYCITLIGIFVLYSVFERCHQWRQRSRQLSHANGTSSSPVVCRTPNWIRWLNHSLKIRFISSNIATKSVLYILGLMLINCTFILHSPIYALAKPRPAFNIIMVGMRCAYVGLVNIGVAMVLVTRNSIVKVISSKSFDETLPMHRWHALLGLSEIAVHVGTQM